ncbi:ech-8 [Pristionchus pacificus]|uniref:Ech-8 n=1 Tax=Pristionchus pacificus TaxID=54126 RepID=A0A8R1YSX0_PRIPA|nr:ech-8 [Pristionchus pacificus]|eukprot:PDM73246.1 ech-8 [Pristionchus pacificus]
MQIMNFKVPKEIEEYLMGAYEKANQWKLPSGESYEDSNSVEMKTVSVIGGGTMGRGIAIALCRAGYDVILVENDEKSLAFCQKELGITIKRETELKRFKAKDIERLTSSSLKLTTRLEDLADCQLVIEAVFENMQLKKELFTNLQRICSKDCVFGSNTSSLNIEEMASVLSDPSRLVGIHFFNPAHVIKVVEIVFGKKTSGKAVATAFEACRAMKKIAVLVGNCPGFVFNRMLFAYMEEAHRLMHENGLMPNQVDEIVRHAGFLMGPITMHDMNGVDVGAKVKTEQGWPVNPIEEWLLKNKRLGRKTGKGFYFYDADAKKHNDAEVEWKIRELASKATRSSVLMSDQDVLEALLFPMVNEGYNLLERGMIADPALIDIMFIFGFGWPRATGGPLKWGESRQKRLAEKLHDWKANDKTSMLELSQRVKSIRKNKM